MSSPPDLSPLLGTSMVDARPSWLIILTAGWRYWFIGLLLLFMLFIMLMPTPDGLTMQGQRALAVFVLCVGLWVTGALPLHITSLLAIVLVPQLGILSARQTYANFSNVAVFFILGAFILSAAMMETGLSTRIALRLLDSFGDSPASLRRGVFFLCAFSSFFMSEHAVAAMIFPMVIEIVRVLQLKPGRSRYAQSLFLALAWGCITGGIGTLLGGARAPLAIGMLEEATGGKIQIGFFQWTLAGLPIVLGAILAGDLLLRLFSKCEVDSVEPARELLRSRISAMGRIRWQEKACGAVVLAAIFSWIFLRHWLGLAQTALLAVVLLFVLRVVDWKRVEREVNWGIILMYGGAICLGKAMSESGAALWLTHRLLGQSISASLVLLPVLGLLTLLLTECISNAAVIAFMFPVAMGLGTARGMDPEVVTFAIAFPAGLAFMFPMGTPATAIAYSSGFFRPTDLIRPGFVLMLISWTLFVLTAFFWWPWLGYHIG